jgi:hypothetical protein
MKRINDLASDESPDQRNQQNLVEDTVAEGPIASDRFGFAPIVGDKWSKSGSCRVNRAESEYNIVLFVCESNVIIYSTQMHEIDSYLNCSTPCTEE